MVKHILVLTDFAILFVFKRHKPVNSSFTKLELSFLHEYHVIYSLLTYLRNFCWGGGCNTILSESGMDIGNHKGR